MMYAIFFIFLGITIALIKFLVPILQTQGLSSGLGGMGFNANPCNICVNSPDPACFSCNAFFAVSAGLEFGTPEDPGSYYKSLFFFMIILQGFFTGLIAGQIASDSVVAGAKHGMIMVFSGFAIYVLILKLGIV